MAATKATARAEPRFARSVTSGTGESRLRNDVRALAYKTLERLESLAWRSVT